ncbi:MAG: ribose 5-phosphate isomerase B [Candidatus Margulisbacteria bacterium]|nr:ribose 5-phosphate isomerase B [Candidatus Margulisiibacteriota bacterium]
MKIAIGSDHGGFTLKEKLIGYLRKQKFAVKDFGTYSEESCDYPDFAFPVAKAVAAKKFARGILVCGSGVGMAITANRLKGVRAVNVNNLYTARQSREHGDANILCLGGRKITAKLALRILGVWLKTPFSGDERHLRRIRKIDQR